MKRKDAKIPRKRVLIVDDHPMMRDALRTTIMGESDLEVAAEAENAHQAFEALQKITPDLILMDISMPGKSGLEMIKDLTTMYSTIPVLVLSMHDESLYAERVLRAGAAGYITKQERPAVLISAIRQVLSGKTYVSVQLSEKIVKLFSGKNVTTTSPLEILTDREFEVFQLIGEGQTTTEIAKGLNLSPKTVAVHYANIRRKLKLGTYPDLIRLAVRLEEARNLPHSA